MNNVPSHEYHILLQAGVAAADAAVGSLRADRATNMWSGLLRGMKLLEGEGSPDRTAVVMLMTDG